MTSEIIGYSGFDIYEDCYQYYENSCYIADTPESAENLMKNSYISPRDYRIDPVAIDQIMNDYGVSCGDFAMEKEAFERFRYIAEQNKIQFSANEEGWDYPIMIVIVEGVRISDD